MNHLNQPLEFSGANLLASFQGGLRCFFLGKHVSFFEGNPRLRWDIVRNFKKKAEQVVNSFRMMVIGLDRMLTGVPQIFLQFLRPHCNIRVGLERVERVIGSVPMTCSGGNAKNAVQSATKKQTSDELQGLPEGKNTWHRPQKVG